MRAPRARLTVDDVERHVRECCFAPADGRRVGVEVEWLVRPVGNGGGGRVPHAAVRSVVDSIGPLPAGGAITFEPGGQVELSGVPTQGPEAACAAVTADMEVIRGALAAGGISLAGVGLDPEHPPRRAVHSPRYDAMETYFAAESRRRGRHWDLDDPGLMMMCSTASVQVNVDLADDVVGAWRLAHDLGPVIAGACANSPYYLGRPTGWRSTRLAAWWGLDPSRARPAAGNDQDSDPAACWADYVLSAHVLLCRDDATRFRPVCTPVPFARWLSDGIDGAYPDSDDLAYHLTTLFPPVRPRRFLELRMVDSLPDPWWQVPVAVAGALLGDPVALAAVASAVAPARGHWPEAARVGLDHPVLGPAAATSFAVAAEVLAGSSLADIVDAYADRYVSRQRCPADDLLAARKVLA
ncbi:MAG: glutamate-cysteine ligase family protein [Acidimicrobiia bacterium]